MIGKPNWLEQTSIAKALIKLIGQLDRQPAEQRNQALYIKLTEQTFKDLFSPAYPGDARDLWESISIACNNNFFTFVEVKRKVWEPVYKNGRLKFNLQAEETVRQWLNMPKPELRGAWEQALEKLGQSLCCDTLAKNPLVIAGKEALDIIVALQQARNELIGGTQLSVRQLAARHLWGDSKVLDARGEEWVAQVLNVPSNTLMLRPVHVAFHCIVDNPEAFLFIENQDTFDMFCLFEKLVGNYAIVYLSGFRGTAGRIRSAHSARLFFSGITSPQARLRIEHLWFSNMNTPAFVWTDLDYAGLAIAIALRRSFSELQWYSNAYERMLERLVKNLSNGFSSKHQRQQNPPAIEQLWDQGIGYLKSINEYGGFIDQESVLLEELLSADCS